MTKIDASKIQKSNFLKATSFTDVLTFARRNSATDVLNRLNEFSKDGYITAADSKALNAKYGEAWNPEHYNLKPTSNGYKVTEFYDAICAKFSKINPDYDFKQGASGSNKNNEEYIFDFDNAYLENSGVRHYLFQRPVENDKHSFKDDWLAQ